MRPECAGGLTGDQLDAIFPFHFAIDERLVITGAGRSLRRLGHSPGGPVTESFEAVRPQVAFDFGVLRGRASALFVLRDRRSGLLYRGQFLWQPEAARMLFLGSPWVRDAGDVERAGLALDDFAVHDPVLDLLTLEQSQRIAMRDLEELTVQLYRQRSALVRTEAIYRSAIAAMAGVPYELDLASNRYTYVDPAIEPLTGCPAERFAPSVLDDLRAPEPPDVEDTLRVARGFGRDGRSFREFRIRAPDGGERWIGDSSTTECDADGRPLRRVGILRDITAEKLAERALRERKAAALRLAAVAAHTSNLVLILDSSGTAEWVNDAFTRLFGERAGDRGGRVLAERLGVPPSAFAADARPLSLETTTRDAAGREHCLAVDVQPIRDAAGATTGWIVVGTDVTARRRGEQRLAQVLRDFETIMDLIPSGVVGVTADGRVRYVNAAFSRLTGLTADALRGSPAADLGTSLAAACGLDGEPPALHALQPDDVLHLHLRRPGEAHLAVSVRELARSPEASAWRVLHFADVTREAQAERLKSEFLTVAAHELRTPMTSVHGFAELLLVRDYDPQTVRTIAGTIHRQSSLLVQMVSELLDLARIESGRGRDFQLAEHELATIVRDTAAGLLVPGDERRPDVRLPGGALRAVCDPAMLRQALLNVLSNAFKYSRGRGTVSIDAVRCATRPRHVGLRVTDEGIGMTPEQVRRVFDRFFRSEDVRDVPGTGLGMTVVREIMEHMGGAVTVDSAYGAGTQVTLWVALPRAATAR